MTYEEVKAELDEADDVMREPCPTEPADIKTRLMTLMEYLPRTADLVSEAQNLLDLKKKEIAEDLRKNRVKEDSAGLLRELLNGSVANEAMLYRRADRLNAALTHMLNATQSLLSYEKQYLFSMRSTDTNL